VPHVRTRAHGCATGADSSRFRTPAMRTICRSARLVITRSACSARVTESCREAGLALLAPQATALPGEVPRLLELPRRCADWSQASCSHACASAPGGAHRCHGCVRVRTGAHGCAAGTAFQTISHIAVRTSWRSARLLITCVVCAARVIESCREAGRTQLATPATAWHRCEVPRSRCCITTRAAAKPAAATRARRREQVHTWCHTCGHVPTRAHGCATGAAFQRDGLAHCRGNELSQRAAGY
jgi:hypothetical protein